MSRLWNRPRLCAYLGEAELLACQVASPATLTRQAALAFPAGQALAGVAALDTWLAAHPQPRATRLEVAVGLPHVRYLLLPWNPQLSQAAVRESVARALFHRQFQEDANRQAIRFGPAVFGQPQLVAFMAQELIHAVEALAARHRLRLSRLEPLLATVWNRFQSQLKPPHAQLALKEASRVLLADCASGAVTALQIRPCTDEALPAQLLQWGRGGALAVFAPTCSQMEGTDATWLQLKMPSIPAGAADRSWHYALCGVC